jgi:hypothetical protein
VSTQLPMLPDPNGEQKPFNVQVRIILQWLMNAISKRIESGGTVVRMVLRDKPSNPRDGEVYFNSVDKHGYMWDGTAWKQIDN